MALVVGEELHQTGEPGWVSLGARGGLHVPQGRSQLGQAQLHAAVEQPDAIASSKLGQGHGRIR